MRRTLVGLVLALAVAASSGCGGSSANSLEGSISSVFALDFDTVSLNQIGDYLVVEYLRASDNARIVKLTVYTSDLQIAPGKGFDLTDRNPPRGTLEHITGSNMQLPIVNGSLTLDQVPTPGMHLSGHFFTTVMPASTTRTLNGNFDGTLVQK